MRWPVIGFVLTFAAGCICQSFPPANGTWYSGSIQPTPTGYPYSTSGSFPSTTSNMSGWWPQTSGDVTWPPMTGMSGALQSSMSYPSWSQMPSISDPSWSPMSGTLLPSMSNPFWSQMPSMSNPSWSQMSNQSWSQMSGTLLPSMSNPFWSQMPSMSNPSWSQMSNPSWSQMPSMSNPSWSQISGASRSSMSNPSWSPASNPSSWMTVSPSFDRSSFSSGWIDSTDYSTAVPTSTSTLAVTCADDNDCPPSFFCNYQPFDDSKCNLDSGPVQPNFTVGVTSDHVIGLYCLFPTDSNLRYKIVWRANYDIIHETRVLTATEADNHHVTAQELSVSDYPLELTYYCEVSVYVRDSNRDLMFAGPFYSNSIAPVEVDSTTIYLPRGGEASLTYRINIPFPCAPGDTCSLNIKLYDPYEDHSCGNSTIAVKHSETCGDLVYGTHETFNAKAVGERRITVTTKNNAKYSLRSEFTLVAKVEVSGASAETWWAGTFTERVNVYVSDYAHYWKGNFCYSNNDPRIRTFDGYYYSMMTVGEYKMMEHTELPVQVNLLTESCNWGFGVCSCGVIVRAGKDVYVVNHCADEHMSAYSSIDDDEVDRDSVGDSSKRVLYARERSSNRWQVYLPQGTRVDITVSSRTWFAWTMVNVEIIPSPSDMGKLKGLCGNFDGDYTNDLEHSDGTITPPTWCWFGCSNPDAFSASWEVSAGNSLLDPANQAALEPWNHEDFFCVCTSNKGYVQAVCSANEEGTCKHIDRPGDVDDYKIRNRRSIESRARRERREDFKRELERSQLGKRDINRRLAKTLEKRQTANRRVKRSAPAQQQVDEATATDICTNNMDNSCGTLLNKTESKMNITSRARNCIQDTMLHSDTNWGPLTCAGAQVEAEVLVTADETVEEDIVNAVAEICNNNCNGRGTCTQGRCQCNSNYAFDDCSLDKRNKIGISGVTGDGACNRGSSSCSQILFVTDGVVSGAKCSVRHESIDVNGTVTYIGEEVVEAEYINAYEVYCPVPTTSRRKRSTGSSSSSAVSSYNMAVSNDGSTYSDSKAVVVLDTTCLTYSNASGTVTITLDLSYCLIDGICYADGTNKTGTECNYCDVGANAFDWSLMSDYCFIDGYCYTNGTTKTGNSCKYCHVDLDTSGWTYDNITESCLKDDDEEEGLEGYVIAIIVVFTLLGVACLVATGYIIRRKYLASKTAKASLFDTPPNYKFGIRVEPACNESWALSNNKPELPKLFPEPKPGTESTPDNLYTDREPLSRSDTVVPAMPWSKPRESPPHMETITIGNQPVPRTPSPNGNQQTPRSSSPMPAAPWSKPAEE